MRRRRFSTVISATVVTTLLVNTSPAAAATWTVMPSQAVGTDSSFHHVAAVSTTDGWVVGGAAGRGSALIERWNGTAWSIVSGPDLRDPSAPDSTAVLSGVDATSTSNAIAVGTASGKAVAIRWNGSAWAEGRTAPRWTA